MPTLKDYLRSNFNARAVAKAYIERVSGWEQSPPSQEQAEQLFVDFMSTLMKVEPRVSEDVFLLTERIDDGIRGYEGVLCKKKDLLVFEPEWTPAELDEIADAAPKMEQSEIDVAFDFLYKSVDEEGVEHSKMIETYAYEFCEWEDVLGAEVLLPENIGPERRAHFIEDVLWELSFNGYDRLTQKNARDELFARLDEAQADIEAGNVYTQEELEDHTKTIREKYGWEDEHSPEEQAAEKLGWHREWLLGGVMFARCLLEAVELRKNLVL